MGFVISVFRKFNSVLLRLLILDLTSMQPVLCPVLSRVPQILIIYTFAFIYFLIPLEMSSLLLEIVLISKYWGVFLFVTSF